MLVVKSQRVVSLCNYFVIFIYLDPVLLYLRPSRGFPSCRGRYKHSNSSLRPRDSSFVIASTTVSGQEAQAFIPTLQLQSSFAISGSTLPSGLVLFFRHYCLPPREGLLSASAPYSSPAHWAGFAVSSVHTTLFGQWSSQLLLPFCLLIQLLMGPCGR